MNQLSTISIQPISNGFLVGHTVVSRFKDQAPTPVVHHCDDFNKVVSYLKTIWPVTVVDSRDEA